jgi:hypothetical protein
MELITFSSFRASGHFQHEPLPNVLQHQTSPYTEDALSLIRVNNWCVFQYVPLGIKYGYAYPEIRLVRDIWEAVQAGKTFNQPKGQMSKISHLGLKAWIYYMRKDN